jgi:hypothetical protein
VARSTSYALLPIFSMVLLFGSIGSAVASAGAAGGLYAPVMVDWICRAAGAPFGWGYESMRCGGCEAGGAPVGCERMEAAPAAAVTPAPSPAWLTTGSSDPGAGAGGGSGALPGRWRWLWRTNCAGRTVCRCAEDGTASGWL